MADAIQGVIGSTTAGTSLVNAFLVAVQKLNFDVKGDDDVAFLFTYRAEDSTDLDSDITDHYTESNTALEDEIALKPIRVTLHGFIGELTDQLPGQLARISAITTQLTALAPYAPALTVAALAAFQQAQQIYTAAASAVASVEQAFNFASGRQSGQTKQQLAYAYFKKKYLARELFTVQTPWEILTNMAIVNVHAVQEEESESVSDFRISFKQLRFATTLSSDSTIAQGRRAAQAASQVSQGSQNPPFIGPLNFGTNSAAFK